MSDLTLAANDPAANRRVWARMLRRPNWHEVPAAADGRPLTNRSPWDVALTLAREYWPPAAAIEDACDDEFEANDLLMIDCYGLLDPSGPFLAAELPERIRNVVLMAARAAQSFVRNDHTDYNTASFEAAMIRSSRNSIAELTDIPDWYLFILSDCTIDLWEYDPSPMRGAVLDPDAVARLIADILDAAPPSLLEPADE